MTCSWARISSTSRRGRGSSSSACGGGVMLSPQDAITTIGERMFLRLMRRRSEVWIVPRVSLLPTNSSSVMRAHLLLGGEEVAAPPLLEAEIARLLGVDLGVEVVRLAPERVGGIQALEVLHQIGAVELAVAEVAGERGEPGAAEQAAGVAHRVHALDARPVGQAASRRSRRSRRRPARPRPSS